MCAKRDKKQLLLIDFAPRESSEQIKNMIWILKLVPSLYLPDLSVFLQAIEK